MDWLLPVSSASMLSCLDHLAGATLDTRDKPLYKCWIFIKCFHSDSFINYEDKENIEQNGKPKHHGTKKVLVKQKHDSSYSWVKTHYEYTVRTT